jgi:GAF domain-containing protein
MEDNQKIDASLPEETPLDVQLRIHEMENRLVQLRTAAEITRLAVSATNLDHLLHRTARLILDRFGYDLVSIFLVDQSRKTAELVEVAGYGANQDLRLEVKLEVGAKSIVGWVTQNNQPRIASDVALDPEYLKLDFSAQTQSEVCIPIAFSGEVLGALDVQSNLVDAFDTDTVAVLLIIANHIGSIMQNIRLLDKTQKLLKETGLLYNASHKISKADSIDEVQRIVWETLQQTGYPHFGLRITSGSVFLDVANLQQAAQIATVLPDSQTSLELTPLQLEAFLDQDQPYTFFEQTQFYALPPCIVDLLSQGGWSATAFFPMKKGDKLQALMILGPTEAGKLTVTDLQPYISFMEFTSLAVEKMDVMQTTQRRLASLQTINTIGQTISVEINLQNLYRIIHREIEDVMGKVNFLIATYDPGTNFIQIPYMHEGEEELSLDPFPLGEGLTSILINTRQPLMIVTDTVNKARELGAKVIGEPARSWMGAPLVVAGDVVGAMVVQDLEREFRFDENDLQLLVTLASQVAVAIRNARLLEATQQQTERQSKLYEITSRIRSAATMQEILITTADELRKAFNIHQTHIEVNIDPPVAETTVTPKLSGEGK